jgi:hypothetical protein
MNNGNNDGRMWEIKKNGRGEWDFKRFMHGRNLSLDGKNHSLRLFFAN